MSINLMKYAIAVEDTSTKHVIRHSWGMYFCNKHTLN